MPRLFTMGTLVTRCQRKADKENDTHISTAEWKTLISEVYGELYGIVAESGMRYFETESTITATGAASYNEPTDHLSTVGLDYVIDAAGRRVRLREMMAQERDMWVGRTGTARRYALIDDQIFLYPNPSSGTYKFLYIPQSPDLSSYADGDDVDVVCPAGEKFLTYGVAAIAQAKAETDASFAVGQKEQARSELEQWASLRALNEPRGRFVEEDEDYLMNEAQWWWGR